MSNTQFPYLVTGDRVIDLAYRIALGDLVGNILPSKTRLLEEDRPVILAGLAYNRPWTRDAAINTWNGAGLLFPDVTLHTLLSTLARVNGKLRIGGQYWDAIIWTVGAWWQYLYTGDKGFLTTSLEAVRNSLDHLEETEFDADLNLFRGPACYGDGVSAYPGVYANTYGNSSSILDWPRANPQRVSRPGYGLPMHALSTNCLYYQAFVLADRMARELAVSPQADWLVKAEALKESIHRHFWNADAGHFRYLVDQFGGCDHQEGLGHAFALLFGLANEEQAEAVLRHQHAAPAGIPCVWPTFSRYELEKNKTFGHHSGTVWPHIQGFWGSAALVFGKLDTFEFELRQLAKHACRDSQFTEIYHPVTGEAYGGLQEAGEKGIVEWPSCPRQTWSATALIRMVLMGLLGMVFEEDGIRFSPGVPKGFQQIRLRYLPYRDMVLDICVEGAGTQIAWFRINGKTMDSPYLPATGTGEQSVQIKMSQ